MTADLVTGSDFASLFRTFTRVAWRLETQGTYNEPYEKEALRRFLGDGSLDVTYLANWLAEVRAATAEGRHFQRVRVVTEPLTDYLRFELAVAPANIEAGEDIRLLTTHQAKCLGLPQHDFWLFDDKRLAILHFARDGLLGAEIVSDPHTLAQHRTWQRVAWEQAAPLPPLTRTDT